MSQSIQEPSPADRTTAAEHPTAGCGAGADRRPHIDDKLPLPGARRLATSRPLNCFFMVLLRAFRVERLNHTVPHQPEA